MLTFGISVQLLTLNRNIAVHNHQSNHFFCPIKSPPLPIKSPFLPCDWNQIIHSIVYVIWLIAIKSPIKSFILAVIDFAIFWFDLVIWITSKSQSLLYAASFEQFQWFSVGMQQSKMIFIFSWKRSRSTSDLDKISRSPSA